MSHAAAMLLKIRLPLFYRGWIVLNYRTGWELGPLYTCGLLCKGHHRNIFWPDPIIITIFRSGARDALLLWQEFCSCSVRHISRIQIRTPTVYSWIMIVTGLPGCQLVIKYDWAKMLQMIPNYDCCWRPTLSSTLPRENDCTIDSDITTHVHPPKGFVHIVVVHDATVGKAPVELPIYCQGGMAISPLRPRVSLVVHPRVFTEGLVGNWKNGSIWISNVINAFSFSSYTTRWSRVDLEETRTTATLVTASKDPSPHANLAMPRHRMEPHVASSHRHVQIVPPLRPFVHVAAKYFRLKMVDIFVEKPDWRVVGVRHGVRGDETFSVSLTFGH